MSINDPDFGGELRRRQSPKFAAEQRRRGFWTCVFGIIMGLVVLIDALRARTDGGMVTGGAANHFLSLPWWQVAPMGLFVLTLSLFGLWRIAINRN
jgi:hypothetical protein